MHLGSHAQLVAFAAIRIRIRGILGVLGVALTVLDGDRVAPVVELHDLLTPGMIREGRLIVVVLDRNCAAQRLAVIFLDRQDPIGLPGIYRRAVAILQHVAVNIGGRSQQIAAVAVADGSIISMGDGGEFGIGVSKGYKGDFRCPGSSITDAAE